MSERRYKRLHLRAPLKTKALYEDEGNVLKAEVRNISEGGILLGELPHVPEINLIPLMLDIPIFPDFSSTDLDCQDALLVEKIERKIVRIRAKIVRTFSSKSAVEQIFIPYIGCRFVDPQPDVKEIFLDYVSLSARNIIFLLNRFESMGKDIKHVELIRKLAGFLGYNRSEHLGLLREQILHDYQSLESL